MLVIGFVIWFYQDWKFQRAENKRAIENEKQLKYVDSLGNARLQFNKEQMNEYVLQNKELRSIIKENNIKLSRIQSISVSDYKYKDTSSNKIKLPKVIEAIEQNDSISYTIVDSTKCLTIKGIVKYANDELSFTITDREFKNKTTVIGYWQRKEWKFLWFKTRFLGKKEAVVKTVDQCGETQIIEINKI
jgi:hypothetical protein